MKNLLALAAIAAASAIAYTIGKRIGYQNGYDAVINENDPVWYSKLEDEGEPISGTHETQML